MELFNLNASQFYSFFLTIMRVSIVVFMLPFFGAGSIPNAVKGAFCLVLSVSIWPRLSFPGSLLPLDALGLILMMMGELVLGLVIDIIIRFLFAAVMTGGHLVGFSMGFAMMNVLDPMTGTSESVTAQLLYQCTILMFLSMNGHLFLLSGLAESFALVPPGGLFITPALADSVLKFSAEIFVLALKISAPVLASLFLVDLALALVSRAAPQMNVIQIGFPVKISVGFLFMTLTLTALSHFVGDYLSDLGPMFTAVMNRPILH
ncbi:MAG: flagellar biosynthetic protein FliR [Desulfovibrio sp.]|nr:flagellar biosynthetic protein FliR [Desulfovibrio sp.]MBI4960010.1 flagellar biosynthetic protein FliR [Desulfovibrio sp.]